jgi:hypothetical protein
MWTCPKCSEQLEDDFDNCWNCGTDTSGAENPGFEREEVPAAARGRDVDCLRCGRSLDFLGIRNFHEGARWGVLGDLAELLVRTEGFEVYLCSGCGRVEFFAHGVGGNQG